MKTKSLLIAVLLMASAALSAVGKEDPRKTGMAIVPVKGSEVFKVIYKGESAGKVKLNIYNAASQVIFSETFNGVDGFIIPVNFKGLQFGEYTIELIDANGKKLEKITFSPNKATNAVHVSKIAGDNKFLLSVANATDSKVTVKIYDAQNNLVHTETKAISGNFAQVYKFTNPSASYTFQVSDDNGNLRTIAF